MAQITGALSAVNALVEYSANGTSWTDVSGTYNKISPGGSTRKYGFKYTFDGDTAIITYGKREPIEITFTFIYTEGASDVYKTLEDLHVAEDGTAFYMRWAPKGATVGNFVYSTGSCKIVSWNRPEIDSESADPLVVEFTVACSNITRSTYTT